MSRLKNRDKAENAKCRCSELSGVGEGTNDDGCHNTKDGEADWTIAHKVVNTKVSRKELVII